MATVKDVAKKAGVSIASVSRILNRKGRFSPETEQLVLKTAEELGYTVNLAARSLKTGLSRAIGIAVNDYTLRSCPSLLLAAAQVLKSHGFDIQLFLNATLADFVHIAREGRVDGLLLTEVEKNDRALKRLMETGKHIVFLGGDIEREDVNLVEIDYFQGGYLATQHLLHLGHSEILFAGERKALLYTQEIMRGYLYALDENGIQYREELIRRFESGSSPGAHDAERDGYEAVEWALENTGFSSRFSAVLATDDRIAYGALHALDERGLSVPEKRSVVGFGNFSPSEYLPLPLTTVDIPVSQMGELGAEILVNNILRKDTIVKRVKLKVYLIHRDTTAKKLT